ncbi:ABC transporter ATP-binding protein [Uliginosibacterium sp. H1]|uniref:ABC transporter ATP-binding protein n=1 Tax=Uliginosibacterium sp. H1 TaxID=3114757 RepID=UPI002E170FDD|nr:ABC transporter ATP-binding protein [Uliginosibacterium sp. H1]
MAAPSPVVALRDLHYRWPGQAGAGLRLPALTLAAGEHLFLHGPSGSGKSTLLGLVAGVLRAQQGSVQVLGQALEQLGGAARDRLRGEHMGIVFQQFNLLPYLSVIDNVLLPCRFSARRRARVLQAGSLRDEAARLLGRLGLPQDRWQKAATALSVGEQQRVAAARALIGRPELLIADEPTSALDAERQQAFIDLLLQEADAAGATVLFVSHDMRLAARFARVVSLTELSGVTA